LYNLKKLIFYLCIQTQSLYLQKIDERCHPWTGKCVCKSGWDGSTCSRPCTIYTFGQGCKEDCTCKNDAYCDPVNGTCLCLPGIDLNVIV
jgi:hypothetical protein